METKNVANIRLRDLIDEAKKEGKSLPQILESLRGVQLCHPPSTSIYYIGRYDESSGKLRGSFIDEGGDWNPWGPINPEEIMDYFDIRTISFRLQRTQDYCPSNPALVADIGS